MNKLRKQSNTTYPLFFLMVDSTDHITGKTGLSPTVTISKNGGSFASPSGAVSEVGNGLYKIAGNATDSNTVGELWIHATGTGADPTDCSYTVVPYDPFDSIRLGLTALPNAAAEAVGGLYTRGSGAGQLNQPANGQIDVNTVKIGGTTQTARDIGASVLLSSGTGTGQVDLSSGVVKSDLRKIEGNGVNDGTASISLRRLKLYQSDPSSSDRSLEIIGANSPAVPYASGHPGIRVTGGLSRDGSGSFDANAQSIELSGPAWLMNGLLGNILGNVTGSVGSLDNQAKTDVRTAVSTVLNTAIPPSPTVDSINERIVNIDEGGISGGSSAADVWSYPTRTLTPIGLGGSVVIPVATITSIITEAFKKAGINSPSTDLMTRAQVQWLEEIRTDLWKRVKKAKFLQARSVTLLVNGLAKYQNPSDFESDLTLEYATGSRYGTAQAGTLGTITLAATENALQADLIGKEIVLLSGSASGQISYIVGYDSMTKVATVSPGFTVAPSTDSYLIIDQYKPLEEKPLWEQQNLPNQTGQGTPDRFFPVGNATDGEFILWPVPYRTDSQPAIVLHRYYADISEIDTTGTLFATLLAKWRNLWLLGLKWKALDDADDDKEPAAQKAYLKELQEITRANYGNDLTNVQTKLGDY